MFTTPAPASTSFTAGSISLAAIASAAASSQSHHPSHAHSSTAAQPSSTSRTRRGLSYLRNYTQNHLTRDRGSQNPTATSPISPPTSPICWSSNGLTRSQSDNPSSSRTTTTEAASATSAADLEVPANSRRFTLVPVSSDPVDNEQSTIVRSTSRRANQSSSTPLETHDISTGRRSMTRSRPATSGTVMATTPSTLPRNGEENNVLVNPSIRFSVFLDPRSQRPSLHFAPISRTLPSGTDIIRVGRYSERDNQPTIPANVPSSAPVGFKSKVVSRRHCEFWYEDGKWYIKDVKSSSGTFLNHIRLSPPGQESKPFPVNDGDVVQLGIDFKGGEEMIFRCVKMRLELNRGWQNKLNKFNMNSHKRLWNMTKSEGQAGQNYSQDCSICLNSIAPCQCLFVAPCSHTWHFKCIRALLHGPSYPIFNCPNCRMAADLEADVEDPEDWDELNEELANEKEQSEEARSKEPRLDPPANVEAGRASSERVRSSLERARVSAAERSRASTERSRPTGEPLTPGPEEAAMPSASSSAVSVTMDDAGPIRNCSSTPSTTDVAPHGVTEPVPIPHAAANARRTPSPGNGCVPGVNGEGPITPRNDAGPWVFDGSGARIGAAPTPSAIARQSLNGVADMDVAVDDLA